MRRMTVFISHTREELAGCYGARELEELHAHADLVFNDSGRVLAGRDLSNAAENCDVILAHRSTSGEAATFESAPRLLAFVRSAVDLSTIDIAAASANGVLVTRASAGFGVAVAEMALGMMLDLARGISRARHDFEHGRRPTLPNGMQLRGASVGILGYGTIGIALAAMTRALGMTVRVFDPHARDVPAELAASLGDTASQSDFVVCLAASLPETRDLVDAHFLALTRPGSFFLNLSRGELVDEDALEAALDSGHLRGAGLDVGRAPDQQPSPRFFNRPDVVLMPHMGGVTVAARQHQARDTVRQVAALAQGHWPEGMVNQAQAQRVRDFFATAGRR